MKWMHLADLHLGRSCDGVSLKEDQEAVLREIVGIAQAERPDGVIIAGDVFDRSLPPESAVTMLDAFILALRAVCPVFAIAGNHDSGERLAYMSRMLEKLGVYFCGQLSGPLAPVTVGDTDVYLLPYMHPAQVRALGLVPPETPARMEDTVRVLLEGRVRGNAPRTILAAHLFVTWHGEKPEECQSEREPVGTLEDVDGALFDAFDYVALGHIHGAQKVGRETMRYAGTPLMYSFSEEHHRKSVCIYDPDAAEKVRLIPLRAGRKMRTVRGLMAELLDPAFDKGDHADFVLAMLQDKELQPDAQARLGSIYDNVRVTYENRAREGENAQWQASEELLNDPLALFEAFFRQKKDREMNDKEKNVVTELLNLAEEDAK